MTREQLNKKETERVKWIFKSLYVEGDRLTPKDLEIASSIESQFLGDERLSKAQINLLEVLYERYD